MRLGLVGALCTIQSRHSIPLLLVPLLTEQIFATVRSWVKSLQLGHDGVYWIFLIVRCGKVVTREMELLFHKLYEHYINWL